MKINTDHIFRIWKRYVFLFETDSLFIFEKGTFFVFGTFSVFKNCKTFVFRCDIFLIFKMANSHILKGSIFRIWKFFFLKEAGFFVFERIHFSYLKMTLFSFLKIPDFRIWNVHSTVSEKVAFSYLKLACFSYLNVTYFILRNCTFCFCEAAWGNIIKKALWDIAELFWNIHTTILQERNNCKWKITKERNNFILRTTFWKFLVPMLKCVRKVHHKNLHFQWQRLYEKAIHFIVATNALVRLCIVRHSYTACFLIKTVLCETSNIFLARTINLNMQEIYLQRYCMKCVPGTHKRKWAINFAKWLFFDINPSSILFSKENTKV